MCTLSFMKVKPKKNRKEGVLTITEGRVSTRPIKYFVRLFPNDSLSFKRWVRILTLSF
jgi:hypothetical protein